jgi:hypothetical protein
MNPIEWYYARGAKQMGPVSSVELKRLATTGEILPDDLVWREGLTEWAPARSVRGLFEDEAKPAGVDETAAKPVAAAANDAEPEQPAAASGVAVPAWHLVDVLLDSLRSDFNARFVDATVRIFRMCGSYGLLAGMALTAAFALIMATKGNALGHLLSCGLVLLLLTALQYAAGKFCDALDRLNRTTGGTLASTALPDCVALLSLMAGLAALFGSVPLAVQAAMYPLILLGIAGFIICGCLALAALNPSTLNISIVSEESPASAEAIGVVAFMLKVKMRVVPVAMGAGVIVGALMMCYACYEAFSGPEHLMSAEITAAAGRTTLIVSAALPLAAYLVFLLYSLLLDLCRAILIVPGKLDTLAKKDKTSGEP